MAKLDKQVDAILERKDFPDFLKAVVATLWQLNFVDDNREETEERKNQLFNTLPRVMDTEPYNSDIKGAINIIRKLYPVAFDWQDQFFEMLLDYGIANHCMLKCPSCGNEAKAQLSALSNTYGLSCPQCDSQGPFYAPKGSFSSGPDQLLPHKSSGGGSCYIATAAYRGYDHPDVRELRRFRDEVLMTSRGGRALVGFYYRIGPELAKSVWANDRLAQLVRTIFLEPTVEILKAKRKK
jgi:hypothetical protein